jgi:hypothetical protein
LILASRRIRKNNPVLADFMLRNVLKLDKIASKRIALVNPGIRIFEDHIEEMVGVLKSLRQELDSALRDIDVDDAKEFAKYFKEGFAEEEQLKQILDRTKSLGKVASTAGFKDFWKKITKHKQKPKTDDSASLSPSYQMDENLLDDFVEGTAEWQDASHYVEQEFRENKEFFNGAHEVIQQVEKLRKNPTRDSVERLLDRINILVRNGQKLMQGLRDHLVYRPEPGKDDESISESRSGGPGLSPAVLKKTVDHYINELRSALGDEKKTIKVLQELYSQVGPDIDRGAVAARSEAGKRLLPILVKFAHANPRARPALLPILRQAAGR